MGHDPALLMALCKGITGNLSRVMNDYRGAGASAFSVAALLLTVHNITMVMNYVDVHES